MIVKTLVMQNIHMTTGFQNSYCPDKFGRTQSTNCCLTTVLLNASGFDKIVQETWIFELSPLNN